MTKSEYLDHLSSAFSKLIPHEYATRQQFKYLRNLKKTMSDESCIVLMDFSENYSYIIQNSAQSFYWTKNSCTLHPVVIYYKVGNELEHQSLCFFSDDREHDVNIVHMFLGKIVEYLKEKWPSIKTVHFFSDGCSAQYKNCENFLHLCQFEQKYGIIATWTFFTTSHGKSPCDGIGGKIKREAANESLRRPYENQITNLDALIEFCKEHIKKVHCIVIKKEEVQEYRKQIVKSAFTVPGTRSFHEFVPQSEQIVCCKHTSTDEQYCLKFDLIQNKRLK